MEAAINFLSSSSPFPSRTHIRNSPSSSSLSVSVLHEQTSVVASMSTASLWRQFPTSALSQEQREECRPSLFVAREDKIAETTLDRKRADDATFVQEHMGTSDQRLGDFKDRISHWSGLSYLLSVENDERPLSDDMDKHKPMVVKSSDAILLAKEALSASKIALAVAESCDVLDADFNGSHSLRSEGILTTKPKRVVSSRLLERRTKRRRSTKPQIINKTGIAGKAYSKRSTEGFDLNDPLHLFLSVSETLLTIQEENELIREIQAYDKLVDVKQKLYSQFNREPTFVEWADAVGLSSKALHSEIHSWKRSHEKLIYANFRMVVHIAKQYQGRGLSLPDLLQEGSMGLMKSVEKFKPQAGCRFPSYAYWWIRQSIRKAIFQHSRTIRLPENMYSQFGKVLEARKSYIQEGHHHPTTEEVARRVGITVEKLQNLLFLMRNPLSMQESVWTDQDTTFQEVTADTKIESPDICVGRQLMRKHIRSLLGTLTSREQQIIKLRYGIGVGCGKRSSLSEIGIMFGLSKERVRQIESRALQKLKQSMQSHGLEAYTDLLV